MKYSIKNSMRMYRIPKAFSAKKRRGLATVVTTAILIAAVSIMGVMLVGWSNSNLITKQTNLESSFNDKMNKLNEDLLVENIWFGTSPNIVNVTLNNVGSVGLNVTNIYIKNSTDTLSFSFIDGGILPSNSYSIQETYNWNSGETVDFSIITNRGNIFTFQEVT